MTFSAVVGCPSWPIAVDSHWTGPALWYASLIFAVCAILTGAQQTLYLGAGGVMSEPTSLEIAHTKLSLTSRSDHRQPSALVVFAWQVPVMLLCWSILSFLAGLCCVIYSPLSHRLRWNSDSKVCKNILRTIPIASSSFRDADSLTIQHRCTGWPFGLGDSISGRVPPEITGTI